ncbi:MAG: hypothetical protein CMM94_04520 [Rickettsiales bacterium]|nr:hypothetical protein [Rickettsiales bacterium]
MDSIILTLVVDSLLALLLFVTIIMSFKLNKRIRVLQDSKSELATIIREFDESTSRATASIAEIHDASKRISDNIQHRLDKANYLADDLQFMIEKGSKLADRMEGGIRGGRDAAKPTPGSARSESPRGNAGRINPRASGGRDNDKEEFAAAVRDKVTRRGGASKLAKEGDAEAGESGDDKRAALDSVLEKVSGRKPVSAEERKKAPTARLRSKAEQELFEAMKTNSKA